MTTIKGFGRLALKGLLVLLPMLALWVYIWVAPMRFVDGEIPNYMWNRNFITHSQAKRYDVIMLGDSMANGAFVPEVLSEKSLDLALGGQTPIEQYYVLREYLQHNPPPKACYISFNDNHFSDVGTFFTRTVYSHSLSVPELYEIWKNARAFNEKFLTHQKDYISYEMRAFNKYLPAIINSGFSGRKGSNEHNFENMNKHRGTYMARTVWETNRQDQAQSESFVPKPMFDFYYRRLLDLCDEYHIQVRVIKLPEAVHVYGDNYDGQRQAYYQELMQQHPSMTDDWLRNGFTIDDFGDMNHLNNHGSYKLSRLLKSMYPEDFIDDSPISRETINGLTDYLQMENEPGFILRWIEGRNFSAAFIVRRKGNIRNDPELAQAITECGYEDGFSTSVSSTFGNRCFYVTGDHHNRELSADGNRFTIREEGWEPINVIDQEYNMAAQFPGDDKPHVIAKSDATDLSVIIFNNYDQKIVAVKNFLYMHGRYVLMKDK